MKPSAIQFLILVLLLGGLFAAVAFGVSSLGADLGRSLAVRFFATAGLVQLVSAVMLVRGILKPSRRWGRGSPVGHALQGSAGLSLGLHFVAVQVGSRAYALWGAPLLGLVLFIGFLIVRQANGHRRVN